MRGLVSCGMVGTQLVISAAHTGLKAAIARAPAPALAGSAAPFTSLTVSASRARNQHGLLGALIRPIFNQPERNTARDALSAAVAQLDGRLPKVATMLEQAEDDTLAFYAFPEDHRTKIRSTA